MPSNTIRRRTWSLQFDRCFVCGLPDHQLRPPVRLETHEICRGPHRRAALSEPAAWLRVCSRCHQDVVDAMPIARQLALKRRHDPECYDRIAVNLLRGRAPEAITEADVDAADETKPVHARYSEFAQFSSNEAF